MMATLSESTIRLWNTCTYRHDNIHASSAVGYENPHRGKLILGNSGIGL